VYTFAENAKWLEYKTFVVSLIVGCTSCRRERALSVDIRHEARGMDFLHYMGDSALSKSLS
jgi:hypothetical protein